MLGIVLGLSAALGFGLSAIFARLALQHMRATTGTLISLVIGTVIAMALAFAIYPEEIIGLSAIAFLWFLLSGFINFPLGRMLNYVSVGLVGVSKSTPIVGASPIFATALAVTIGGESLGLLTLLGTFSIIGGLALILSQR
ncbi:MAG: EamA family transporter [Chloroflexi bacterium]|nr:EamA family transporter [Chloroflexota bacterium]